MSVRHILYDDWYNISRLENQFGQHYSFERKKIHQFNQFTRDFKIGFDTLTQLILPRWLFLLNTSCLGSIYDNSRSIIFKVV